VFAWCVAAVIRDGVTSPSQFVIFAALTFASGRLTVKVPSVEARFALSEMFAFTSVLLFGPATGAVMLAVDSLVLSWRHRMRPEQALFNFGNLSLAVWLSGSLFFAASGLSPLFDRSVPADGSLLLALALMAAAYFGTNSGLIAIAIALEKRERPWVVWRSHFLWLAPGYATGASVALLVVIALQQVQFSALALLVPVMLVSYLMLRSSFGRLEDAKQHVDRLNGLYLSTVETLATAIDAKDDVTHGHVRRVQGAAVALAREMGITDPQLVRAIEAAALLHDTGKIAVPEHILNKPARLTPAEFEKMKLHAPIGAEILSAIDFPYPVVPIVRHHHENWDGTGYPDGIRGADIPIGARILSVVDCFDALTSDRPYRRRMSDRDALRIVMERRGTMYDPLVVDTFARCYARIMPAVTVTPHPAAKAVGGARERLGGDVAAPPFTQPAETPVLDELVAFTSLSRAVSGDGTFPDVGALAWIMVRNVIACDGMALFTPDEECDAMVPRYAAGAHAALWRRTSYPMSVGSVGWTAVTWQSLANSEPMLDASPGGLPDDVPPHAMCTVPLLYDGELLGVLALYTPKTTPFTEHQVQLLELLAPQLSSALAAVPEVSVPVAPPAARRASGPELHLVHGGLSRTAMA
jgi:putative nucleotidyltransferase with HDIG domain